MSNYFDLLFVFRYDDFEAECDSVQRVWQPGPAVPSPDSLAGFREKGKCKMEGRGKSKGEENGRKGKGRGYVLSVRSLFDNMGALFYSPVDFTDASDLH